MSPVQTTTDPIIHKVRRRTTSRGRARGREAQRERRQMRAMPRMREVAVDEAMTSFGGVAGFATICRVCSIDDDIAKAVAGLKVGPAIVYPLERVFAALVPMAALGMGRVFGFEQLAGDPLVEHVFGGEVPSIDTLYRDLRRVDGAALDALEAIANRLALQVFSTRHGGEALAPGAIVDRASSAAHRRIRARQLDAAPRVNASQLEPRAPTAVVWGRSNSARDP